MLGRFALVPPDVATCPDCAADFTTPGNRRFGYPFTNCTNCGPRYTIIRDVPYDRPLTTMAEFQMCARCQREYEDPLDRRFHAEPNACPDCGPSLALLSDEELPSCVAPQFAIRRMKARRFSLAPANCFAKAIFSRSRVSADSIWLAMPGTNAR